MIGSPQWFLPVLQLAVSKAKKTFFESCRRKGSVDNLKVGIAFDFVSIILTTNVVQGS